MNYVFDIKKKTFSWTKAMQFLKENGFVTIRNIFDKRYTFYRKSESSWVVISGLNGISGVKAKLLFDTIMSDENTSLFLYDFDPNDRSLSDSGSSGGEEAICTNYSVSTEERFRPFIHDYGDTKVPYYHKVQSGDTIECLSMSYKISIDNIVSINKEVYGSWDGSSISPGDKVYLAPYEDSIIIHNEDNLVHALFKIKCMDYEAQPVDGGWQIFDEDGSISLEQTTSVYDDICSHELFESIDKDAIRYGFDIPKQTILDEHISADEPKITHLNDSSISPTEQESFIESISDENTICPDGDTDSMVMTNYDERCDPYSDVYHKKEDYGDEPAGSDSTIQYFQRKHERSLLYEDYRSRRKVEGWSKYLEYINAVRPGVPYEHEVLFYEKPYDSRGIVRSDYTLEDGSIDLSLGEKIPLVILFPDYYEIMPIENQIYIPEENIRIPSGLYSLRKVMPSEGGSREFNHITKRLESAYTESLVGITKSREGVVDRIVPNQVFDYNETYDDAPIAILGSDRFGSVDSFEYHNTRKALLQYVVDFDFRIIMSPSAPEGMRCSEGDGGRARCGGWCIPDAAMSFVNANISGYDRYGLTYDYNNVSEMGYRTGWKADPTPWLTESSGPVSISSVYNRQRNPTTDSNGWWGTVRAGKESEIRLQEWPYHSDNTVEYAMPLKIIRDNSRNGNSNREQRFLKTCLELYGESLAVSQESIYKYSIYFVIPNEAFNPFKGECNLIAQYYEAYEKLAGKNGYQSPLTSKHNSNYIRVDNGGSIEDIWFPNQGPDFTFSEIEDFYHKWLKKTQ